LNKPRFSKRHYLSKRELKAFRDEVFRVFPEFPILEFDYVEEARIEDVSLYIINGAPALLRVRDKLIPSLRFLIDNGYAWVPRVGVDRGAVKALIRGADLMLPGIKVVEGEFRVGSIVVVYDVESKTPIMIGEALMDSSEISRNLGVGRGKAVKSIHYVGDKLWVTTSSI